ncbi:PAS domain S-box protein [Evansella tamaricis]|uniref:PAS domain S-box protein n=1 Tax=Evansella tamaricis TaxID=2069301 RepID=A0ABS6JHK7_9BACI|nr:PAS domain S-box protein [Evansella tamaricis]MBU9713162.1 PAS domain S-box protein [Evansella tamaricis]
MTNETDTTWKTDLNNMAGNKKDHFNHVDLISATLDYLQEAVFIVDKSWNIKYCNEAAMKTLTCTKDDLLESFLWDKFSASIRTAFYEAYQKSILEDTHVEFIEYDSWTKKWLNVRAFPSCGGLTFICNEKPEKNIETAVSEEVYRNMFKDYPDAVCSFDLNGKFLTVNKAFSDLFNINEEKLIGNHFSTFLPNKKKQFGIELFENVKKGSPQTVEVNLSNEIGKPFVVMLSVMPIIINTDILGAYVIIKNITKYYLNVDEIRRLYEMNQSIMEAVEDGILGLDKNLDVIMWNEAAERITGYRREELTVKSIKNLMKYVQPSIENFIVDDLELHNIDDVFINQSGVTFFKKDGTPFISEFTLTPMISGENVVGCVLTFRDITEKKNSEELIYHSEKLSAVGQLAAGIAHEIRNPLTSLKGFLQLIQFNKGGKDEYFEIMNSEFNRIEQILNELLILSKPQTMEKEVTSLVQLLDHTVTLLNTQAIIKNIKIRKEFQINDAEIECAEHQIKQVFVNLIKNAIEATPNGGKITVSITKRDGNAVVIVKDNGCGIPKGKLKRIGEPFFTTKDKGTGLGLMVSYQIIEDHGGKVHVDSEEGVGTTFTVHLPLVQ